MTRPAAPVASSVPSEVYDRAYLLSDALEGYDDYLAGTVSVVKRHELDLLDVQRGHRVLDVGCGRGEVAGELLRRGARVTAIDYAWDAARLTHEHVGADALVARADAVALPFPDGAFDRVLLGDVIEHLPAELGLRVLREVRRLLAPGGRALVHTSPNTWFTSFVMRPLRLVLRLLGRAEVLAKFDEYERLRPVMHFNEMNPATFRRLFRMAGVPARTWVGADVLRSGSSGWTAGLAARPAVRVLGRVAGAWPFRLVLGNDLYAVVTAEG